MVSILEISDIRSLDIIISILGYVVVMISLLLLHLFFFLLPKILYFRWKREKPHSGKIAEDYSTIISGEEIAAIAIALNQFLEIHDEESGLLTISKVSKPYSPWSSKIYAVRNQFNRI